MKQMGKAALAVFFIGNLFRAECSQTGYEPEQQEVPLTKENEPLIFALGEGLLMRRVAYDEDLGAPDTSNHPRTQVLRRFLENYKNGEISEDLLAEDSAEVLRAYMEDLRKKNLRYTDFRIGPAEPKKSDLYQIRAKLIGYGQKIFVSIIMVCQNDQNWKILAFSADYPL